MAILDTAGRNKLPDSAFALPGRKYPVHDQAHAKNALARVSEYGTPDEKSKVKAEVMTTMYLTQLSKFRQNDQAVTGQRRTRVVWTHAPESVQSSGMTSCWAMRASQSFRPNNG